MANDKYYIPGDFYRICDRTGFKVRAHRTRKEWTGNIVREGSWEPRHTQDFVRGVRDDQSVVDSRPRQIDSFVGPLATTLTANVAAGAQVLAVHLTSRFIAGDRVTIMLDNMEAWPVLVASVDSLTQLTVNSPLPYRALSGALVTNMTANSEVTV